ARRLPPALAQDRKEMVDAVERLPPGAARLAAVAADVQVFLDGHPREQPPTFRHQRDAVATHEVRCDGAEVEPGETQLTRARAVQPGDRVDEHALAGAVRSDDQTTSPASPSS